MPMGPGAERWCRLLLIVSLALLLPIVGGITVDDGWTAVAEPGDTPDDTDDARVHLAAGAPGDPVWTLPAPVSFRRVGSPDARDPVIAGWTSRTPTDRAPPRV